MVSRNDQLSLRGRAPRARRSCYVDEPACGFCIVGSSIKPMNGVYVRRNPPPAAVQTYASAGRTPLLYYSHMERGSEWTMALVETRRAAEAGSDEEDDDDYGGYSGSGRPPPERWWCLGQERPAIISGRVRHVGALTRRSAPQRAAGGVSRTATCPARTALAFDVTRVVSPVVSPLMRGQR